ncbi:MAG: LytTR family DNA-binding domain-containing protein [Cyclobacteriaceae bacterium]
MKILNDVVQLLNRPFPDMERLTYFKLLISLSLFVTFFLYVFEPFGLSTLEDNQFLICLGFGSMTFVGALVYDFFFHMLLKLNSTPEKWTYGKWVLDNLGYMLFISLANFLYARLVIIGFINWELFPQMIYSTFMIGIIPLMSIGAWTLLSGERKYQHIAEEINQGKSNGPARQADDSGSLFDIPTHQIRYVEALQNYSKIGYITPEGELKEKIERTTLKGILSEAEGSSIVKCHRSYLVNRVTVVNASGNAQGLLLSLADCDKVIPVSRTCVADFRN